MKRILLICLIFLSRISISAQTVDSILGKWYVEKVIITENSIPQDHAEKLKELITAFSKSSFQFEANGKFSFDFPFKEMQIPEGRWSYDNKNKTIKVTEVQDPKSKLMMINVEKGPNGEIYFLLHETPLKLKMKR